MTQKEIFASRLKQLRGNTPRKDLADAVGVSVSTIQMYENGNRMPNDEIKQKLVAYFGVTYEYLFFGQREHETCSVLSEQAASTA